MARLFTCGFEEVELTMFDTLTMLGFPAPYMLNDERAPTSRTPTPRTGRGCLRLHSNAQLVQKNLAGTPAEVYVGLAIWLGASSGATNNIAFITFGTGLLQLYLASDGTISIRRNGALLAASSTGVISFTGTWHYLEIYAKPATSGGVCTVKVDGSQVVTFSGNTATQANVDYVALRCAQNSNVIDTPTVFDDFVINDTSGSVNNTYPGQVRLLPIFPVGNGATNNGVRVGTDLGSNAAQARNFARGFAALQYASTGDKDLFTADVPDLPGGATITNIIVAGMARQNSGGNKVCAVIRAGSTESDGTARTLTSAWSYFSHCYSQNPDNTSAWIEADLSGLQIGAKATT